MWVSGLQPGSRYAWNIQGPLGGCAPINQPANTALQFRDLVADPQGVASMHFDVVVHEQILARGYDIAVFSRPSPPIGAVTRNSPMLLCGNIGSVPGNSTRPQTG